MSLVPENEILIKKALEIIPKENIHFLQDLWIALAITHETANNRKLNKNEDIREAINSEKIRLKQKLRNKWANSNVPALQISLYRLLADDDEYARLSQNKDVLRGLLDKVIDEYVLIKNDKTDIKKDDKNKNIQSTSEPTENTRNKS